MTRELALGMLACEVLVTGNYSAKNSIFGQHQETRFIFASSLNCLHEQK